MRAVRRNDDESHGAGRGIVPWPHGRDPCASRVRHGGDVFCAVTVRQRGIMGISSRGAPASSAPETLTFDRKSGRLAGANLLDRATVLALQAGSVATGPFGHRGYGLGCRLIVSVAAHREIVMRLNEDATFAMRSAMPTGAGSSTAATTTKKRSTLSCTARARRGMSSSIAAQTSDTGRSSPRASPSARNRRLRSRRVA